MERKGDNFSGIFDSFNIQQPKHFDGWTRGLAILIGFLKYGALAVKYD